MSSEEAEKNPNDEAGEPTVQKILKLQMLNPTTHIGTLVKLHGWIYSVRTQGAGTLVFIDLGDGTTVTPIRCLAQQPPPSTTEEDAAAASPVVEFTYQNDTSLLQNANADETHYSKLTFEEMTQTSHLSIGCSVMIHGHVSEPPAGTTQSFEIKILELFVIGPVQDPVQYPIQKSILKNPKSLRGYPHARFRAPLIQQLMLIRSQALFAVHDYFHEHNVPLLDPNIMTSSDCEGAGEVFKISPQMFTKPAAAVAAAAAEEPKKKTKKDKKKGGGTGGPAGSAEAAVSPPETEVAPTVAADTAAAVESPAVETTNVAQEATATDPIAGSSEAAVPPAETEAADAAVETPVEEATNVAKEGEAAAVATEESSKAEAEGTTTTTTTTTTPASTTTTPEVGLTVSSQLPLEAISMGTGSVYTCQKSFRAEKSDTNKHLAEFLHVEYEQYFITLEELMDQTEDFVKSVISKVLNRCQDQYHFLNQKHLAPNEFHGHGDFLKQFLDKPFTRIRHHDAVECMLEDLKNKVQVPNEQGKLVRLKFQTLPKQGEDLASEHEKYLVQKFGGGFCFVTHWPSHIKSFYMKQVGDGTCESFDLLAPLVGELFGGSMREWRYNVLQEEMAKKSMDMTPLQWFVDLRLDGTAPHGGWGMGFDRLCMLLTNTSSVRDIVPYPVYYGHCPY